MLQRVQTIWLFFASAAIFSLFLFPYLKVYNVDGSFKALKITGVQESVGGQIVQTESFIPLTIVAVLIAIIPMITIFLFKDRKLQIKLCYLTIVAILGFSFWLVQNAKAALGEISIQTENYGLGIVLPSLSIFFMILALRGIKKDENLVKSADRLR